MKVRSFSCLYPHRIPESEITGGYATYLDDIQPHVNSGGCVLNRKLNRKECVCETRSGVIYIARMDDRMVGEDVGRCGCAYHAFSPNLRATSDCPPTQIIGAGPTDLPSVDAAQVWQRRPSERRCPAFR